MVYPGIYRAAWCCLPAARGKITDLCARESRDSDGLPGPNAMAVRQLIRGL